MILNQQNSTLMLHLDPQKRSPLSTPQPKAQLVLFQRQAFLFSPLLALSHPSSPGQVARCLEGSLVLYVCTQYTPMWRGVYVRVCVCVVGVRGRDWLTVGGSVGVCREDPSLLCYFSWGTFYKKIIYCTHFVYLEKELKLFCCLI